MDRFFAPAVEWMRATKTEFVARFEREPGRNLQRITLFFFGLGVALRLIWYLRAEPLWLDEAYVAFNVMERSFSDLLKELDYDQYAPVGYLFTLRASFLALGPTEYAFRLYSLFFALLGMYLFYRLAKEILSPTAVPVAVGLLVFTIALLDELICNLKGLPASYEGKGENLLND